MSWLTPLPDAERMRAADAAAIAAGTPGTELMERAGRGLAAVVVAAVPDGRIAVVCGKGNNGGDGHVVARVLREQGREVRLLTTVDVAELTGDAAHMAAQVTGEPAQPFAPAALDGCAGIVDCLLGTGFAGTPREPVAGAIAAITASPATVVACDVPSGVDASTGAADPKQAVHADHTATFAAAKPGLLIHPGKALVGRLHVVGIGLEDRFADAAAGLITAAVLGELPDRAAASTKFSSGHVLVAGGSRGLTGAVCLAAEAAGRAGAGYVTALVPGSLEAIFEVKLTEVMSKALPDDGGTLTQHGADVVLEQAAARGGALVLGGGLGRSDTAQAFVRRTATGAEAALVLDADGINAFSGDPTALAGRTAPTVLTPHAGELARLLGTESRTIEGERLHHAREAARITGAIVVLKGDDTLVAAPDGRVAISEGGAPGLATAGTGDVLAGVTGAFLATGLDPFTAAAAAVNAHLRAGRRAAALRGGPRGVTASDVVDALPHACVAPGWTAWGGG